MINPTKPGVYEVKGEWGRYPLYKYSYWNGSHWCGRWPDIKSAEINSAHSGLEVTFWKEINMCKEAKFDPKKPVVTRDGKVARIICDDRDNNYPIVALIGKPETVYVFTKEGRFHEGNTGSPSDLINIPEVRKHYRFVSKFGTLGTILYTDLVRAKNNLDVSDDIKWVGISETVFTDDTITQINFIPR